MRIRNVTVPFGLDWISLNYNIKRKYRQSQEIPSNRIFKSFCSNRCSRLYLYVQVLPKGLSSDCKIEKEYLNSLSRCISFRMGIEK